MIDAPTSAGDLVKAVAAARSSATAIIYGDEQITYEELEVRSAAMAQHLGACGVRAGSMVGVMLDRSPELLISILAIWTVRAIYVPLDPSYPDERLRFCAYDAALDLLITDSRFTARRVLPAAAVLTVDRPTVTAGRVNLGEGRHDADVAYVMYTSGTTGKPKGVVGTHCGIVNSIEAQQRILPFTPDDLACHKAPIGFIDAIFEALVPLASGLPLLLAPADRVRDPVAFMDLIETHGATRLMLVPSMARALLKVKDFSERGRSLRCLILNSEPVDRVLVTALAVALPQCRFFHAYGATETSGDMCFNEIAVRLARRSITVGLPIANMQVRLLDRDGIPVPPGTVGEIYAAGIGIAKGYLNQPDITAAKFVSDHLGQVAGVRLYRTGDMARQLPNGEFELMGRRDRQVKVKGSRIELGEIETVMRELPGIDDVAIVSRESPGGMHLAAYVVLTTPSSAAPARLRDTMRRLLPGFMVPSTIEVVASLPLSSNGKVNVSALQRLSRPSHGAAVAPDASVEAQIVGICAEVLELPAVEAARSFFELGGDSLSAMSLVAEIEQAFGVDIPVSAIFEADSVAALAREVETRARRLAPTQLRAPKRPDGLLPLSGLQRMFWSLDRITLHDDRDTFSLAVELSGPLDAEALLAALSEATDRHPMLRCRLRVEGGTVWQCPGGAPPLRPERFDLSDGAGEATPSKIDGIIRDLAARGFDLELGPPSAAALIKLAPERHVLLVTLHHLVADDISLEIVQEEIARSYRMRLALDATTLPRQKVVGDAHSRATQPSCAEISRQLAYWRRQLNGTSFVQLPLDRPRRAERGYRGATCRIDLPAQISNRLKETGYKHNATPFAMLAAVIAIWLSIVCSQSEVVLRIDVSERRRPETRGQVGLFVNFVPIRIRARLNDSFADVIALTREAVLAAMDHSDIPYHELADALSRDFGSEVAGLDRIVLAMQRRPVPRDWLVGVTAQELEVGQVDSEIDSDLELYWTDAPDGLHARLDYSADLFDAASIAQLVRRLHRVVTALVDEPHATLRRIAAQTSG